MATELEKDAKKREDIRSKDEWQIEENDSESEQSMSDKDMAPEEEEGVGNGVFLTDTGLEPNLIKKEDGLGDPEENEEKLIAPEDGEDLVDEFVFSDDEAKTTTKKKNSRWEKKSAEKKTNLNRKSHNTQQSHKPSGKNPKIKSRTRK